jgi:hypothetical protein
MEADIFRAMSSGRCFRATDFPLVGSKILLRGEWVQRGLIMIKNCLFAVALLSLALAGGCAKGGNGVVPPPPAIDVTVTSPPNVNSGQIYPTQSLTLTATVSHAPTTAVTWSLSGPGTLTPVTPPTTPATATYVAPTSAGSTATITATLTADTTVKGTLTLTIVDITTDVAPSTLSVGKALTQQFTAVAIPDTSPQTFTWSCTAGGVPCTSFSPAPNVPSPGLASYTAKDNCTGSCVQISALSTLDPSGCSKNCTIAKFPLVASRVSGTYAFRFSGYDSSNHATAVVGTFTVASNGAITGVEDEMTSSGPAQYSITAGSYNPITASDPNSNNAGTLTLTTGAFPDKFQVVLDGAGDIEMIESDGHGTGSGIAQKSSNSNLFTGNQTYAFGFTGVDAGGNRVGYVGILPMNGSGMVVAGQMDVNDNGNDTNICGAGPCSVAGTYSVDPCNCGLWHMTLNAGSALLMNFDFFISSGQANKANPLTFYAISTNPVATYPAVSGTMVLQDSSLTYDKSHFKGTSVSALTGANGANANVSLTLGTTDGNGNFSGQFDQNNAGVILSTAQFPPSGSTSYTYAASGTTGRFTFNMLGDPTAKTVVPPIPFVLYASGANRGFLLDQSSSSGMTGTMNPQGKGSGFFGNSTLPGTFAAATTGSGSSAVTPIAANLLVTFPGGGVFNVSGTQYPGPQTVTGTYDLTGLGKGTGTIKLTAPSAQNYVIYVLDTSGCTGQNPVCAVQDFLMMDVDKTNPNASVIFAQE